ATAVRRADAADRERGPCPRVRAGGTPAGRTDGPGNEEDLNRLQVIGEHKTAWQAWFASAGGGPLRVSYEERDAAMAGGTLASLGFPGLDVPDGPVIAPRKPE